MKKIRIKPNEAQIYLGQALRNLREDNQITYVAISKHLKKTRKQIEDYEKGEFIPMAILEKMSDFLGNQITKRDIRRISKYRKFEAENKTDSMELFELYKEIFEG